MIRIPNKDKQFVVNNASFSKGNIYGTFNFLPNADVGKIKLNHPVVKLYSTTDNADFARPIGVAIAQKNGGGGVDAYVIADKTGGGEGYVWSVAQGSLTKLVGTNTPTKVVDSGSDIALAWDILHVTDADGLHRITDSSSGGNWTAVNSDAGFVSKFIVIYFQEQNRLYFFNTTSVKSCTSAYAVSSGSYEITSGLAGITCARAASKRIWFASSGANGAPFSKIYEWDGVNTNPINIFTIPTAGIQNIVILNDIPIAVDLRGRLWFYDGYQFVLKEGVNFPAREDDFGQTCKMHRNGSFAEAGKAYFLVSGYNDGPNTSERALAGIWCYDPNIGLYHFASPDNISRITTPYALSKYVSELRMIAGYFGSTDTIGNANSRISVTETTAGISGTLRTGFLTTQFVESQSLTDMFNAIVVKFRRMIYTSAQIEVKYRTWKNIECNTTITWTSATTFTCATADLAGSGTLYNTQVVVGDEVMVQQGVNAGLIAHVTVLSVNGATTTVTIDRNATISSGTAYAMFANYTLLKTISYASGDTFKNIRLGKATTMVQIKLVMQWKGYYDELQEILIDGLTEQKPS